MKSLLTTLLAAAIAIAAQCAAAAPSTAEPFAVAEVGPSGTVPHENLDGGVWVLFNKPVIALKTLSKPATSSDVLTLTPHVDGIYRWYGSRLLAFEPTGQLAPATEYVFGVSPALRSLSGEALSGDTRFSFRTEPLALVSVTPTGSDVPPPAAREIVVTFNYPVDLATIMPSLRLDAGGVDVPFDAARPVITNAAELGPYEDSDRLVSLKPARELPWDSTVKVRVLAGARPRPGTYGTDAEISASFHTLVPLEVEDSYASMGRLGATAELRFNHALQPETVTPGLRLAFPGYALEKNLQVSGSWVILRQLPVDYESSFSIGLLAGLTDIYGQALGSDQAVSLDVGPAPAYVDVRGSGQRILESQFPARVAMEMMNIDAGGYAIGKITDPFGAAPRLPTIAIDTAKIPRNYRHFEILDLGPYLNPTGKGAAYLSWSFTGNFYGSDTAQDVTDTLVVQVTDIGASISVSHNAVLVRAASLASGTPFTDAAVTLRKGAKVLAAGRTDAAGLAVLALAQGALMTAFADDQDTAEIEIARGADRLVVRPSRVNARTWNSSAPYTAEDAQPLTYLWSDRGIYRRGETMSFAGIDRDLSIGKLLPVKGRFRVDLVDSSGDGTPIGSVSGSSSASGSFSGKVDIPASADPGDLLLVFHRVTAGADERTGSTYVRVASFRRVSFAVSISLPKEKRYIGDTLEGRFSGSYLAGGSVSKGNGSWFWTRRETWYQPPGDALADYTFGDVQKGWAEDLGSDSGPLGGTGETVASQKLGDGDPGRVYTYELNATVEDVDRQAISKSASHLVFASGQLLGGKITTDAGSDDSLYFVKKGQAFTLKVVSVDPDGSPVSSGDVSGRLLREEWNLVRQLTVGGVVDTRYEKQDVVEKTFTVRPRQPWTAVALATQKAGSYAIELSGQDAQGRPSFTRMSFYSTGADTILWQRYDERQIELVPDRKTYSPGETAHILIKSPVARGSFLVTTEREGVLDSRVVDLAGSAPTIDVPIKEEHVPLVYVFVSTAVGRTSAPPANPDTPDFGKPRGYSGLVSLPVATSSRTIALTLSTSKDSYLPGSDAQVTLKATWKGAPLAGAEIALVAADRGVLDLIDYHVQDPIDFFYNSGNYPDSVAHYDTRDLLLDPVTWKANDLPGGDEKGESAPVGIGASVRKDFNPTAVFRTGLMTGRDGTVTVRFKLPDLLTRFRATAIAVKGDTFGIAEGEILVQNPINVRTALPRRMRVGDGARAGVVLTNLDSRPRSLTITLSAQGLGVTGATRAAVTVRPGETTEVAFDLAASTAGTARLAFSVDSDILKERLEDTLPIDEAHITESFTIVGKTGDTAREAMEVPAAFLGAPEEGLSLTLDSTIASALAGAVRFLDLYPYDCLEQVTSKLFSRVLFPSLAGGSPDLGTLARFANPDGGFSYWDDPAPRRSNYYVSLRVAHLLEAASGKGIRTPPDIRTDALLGYLEKGWKTQDTYLQAYALYVLSASGRKEGAMVDSVARMGDRVGVFGYGFLGLSYAASGDMKSAQAVLARLKSFLRVGTRTVTLVGTVNDWLWYGGGMQAKSLLLMLYARVQPDSQLVLGLANDLLASSGTGYWGNTSNAGWVLQAFAEMIDRGGESNPDFTANVRLGNTEVARNRFRGFSRAPWTRQVSVKDLLGIAGKERGTPTEGGTLLPLTFGLNGKGTLYYTAMLRSSQPAAGAEARDEGIGIAAEVHDETGALVDGTTLSLGKAYTMKVVFYSSQDRTFLALRAPLPSGAEPIDGSLLTSQVVKPSPDQAAQQDAGYGDDERTSGSTTRIYDNEVRFFFEQVDRGKHELTFLFRTTTPGVYPTPPVQAELMYQPEVFGRTAGSVITIR